MNENVAILQAIKPVLLQIARRLRLLGFADTANYWRHRLTSGFSNRQFVRSNPKFPVPPARLAFEAYGHLNWQEYATGGSLHAQFFSQQITQHLPHTAHHAPRILEWGCGAARISRHLPRQLRANATLVATDIDNDAIAWCRANIPGIEFSVSKPNPPLPFTSNTFDAACHYSVWTHMSDRAIKQWIAELWRVLAPGGVLIGTSHGDYYQRILLPHERRIYSAGQPVFRSRYTEGRKLFLSFLPSIYLESLLKDKFSRVQHLPGNDLTEFPQDTWIAIK